jgi:ssDNA-binding Zn-finger/Zn-ribbon topoisomerase 1
MQEEIVKNCPACGRDMQAVSFSTFEGTTYVCSNNLCDYEETEPNET